MKPQINLVVHGCPEGSNSCRDLSRPLSHDQQIVLSEQVTFVYMQNIKRVMQLWALKNSFAGLFLFFFSPGLIGDQKSIDVFRGYLSSFVLVCFSSVSVMSSSSFGKTLHERKCWIQGFWISKPTQNYASRSTCVLNQLYFFIQLMELSYQMECSESVLLISHIIFEGKVTIENIQTEEGPF